MNSHHEMARLRAELATLREENAQLKAEAHEVSGQACGQTRAPCGKCLLCLRVIEGVVRQERNEFRAELEEARKILKEVTDAWKREVDQGDGLPEDDEPIYVAARGVLAKKAGGA